MENNEITQRLDDYLAKNFIEEDFDDFQAESPMHSSSASSFLRYCFTPPKSTFEKFFEKNKGETFSDMLTRLVEESGKKNSEIYNRADIDRQLFSKIKNRRDYQPSKDTAISLAIALELNLDKAKDFLASAGYTLSKSKRDLIITFFIENKLFDTRLLNNYLHDYDQPILLGR